MTTRTRLAALAGALGVLGALGSCGADPTKPRQYLEGSLGQVMDLGFDEARVIVSPIDVSLLFVRIKTFDTLPDGGLATSDAGTTEDYPFKVAVDLRDGGLFGNVRIDLVDPDTNGNQRGTASRNVLNDPRKIFPDMQRGTLFFDRVPKVGETVNGDFNVTFEDGVQAASGRTVFIKSFSAKVGQ